MLTLTEEQAESIHREECWDEDLMAEHPCMQVVSELDYDDQGKYSYGGKIFTFEDKYYLLGISRSGSYFSDYYWDYELDCPEVQKQTITKEVWCTLDGKSVE